MLLNMAAAMVDGVYQEIAEKLKPGVKESEIVALATMRLYLMGSTASRRSTPSRVSAATRTRNFTDRIIRPGDQAFFDIIHSYMGYKTCYYRTFSVGMATPPQREAYGKAREWMDLVIICSSRACPRTWWRPLSHRAGHRLRHRDGCLRAELLPRPGPGPARAAADLAPELIRRSDRAEDGMVFAVETYCPASDGALAARIEEEVILMPTGPKVISLYPAQELPIACNDLSKTWPQQQ